LHAFLQVCGDPVRHQLERQIAAFALAIQANDVEAIPSRNRLRSDRAWLECK
jgi:hypothetical protein